MKKFILLFILPFIISIISIAIYNKFHIADLFTAFLLGFIIAQFINNTILLEKVENYYLYFLIPIGLFFYGSQINLFFLIKQKPVIYIFILSTMLLYFLLIIPINKYLFHILNRRLNYLLAAANAICGISATIVLIPFTGAKKEEVSITIISIFITGLISSIIFIYLIDFYFNLNTGGKSILAATTVNNTGSILFIIENININLTNYVMTIKGFRVSTIIPISITMMCLLYNKDVTEKAETYERFNSSIFYALMLSFILICSSIIFTFLQAFHKEMTELYKIVFCMVLAGIGMSCRWTTILNKIILINIISSLVGWFAVTFFGYFFLKLFYL
jgi:uncharacterized integral membrane protein (TIGR00698 family)